MYNSDSTLPYNTWYSSQQGHSLTYITYFTHPNPPPPLVTISLFSILQSISWLASSFLLPFAHLLCFLNSTYGWNHMVFAFLWLISLSIVLSTSIHVVANGKISLFFYGVIFYYVYIIYIPHFLHPSIHQLWSVSIIWLL